jgi:hypothetical protein
MNVRAISSRRGECRMMLTVLMHNIGEHLRGIQVNCAVVATGGRLSNRLLVIDWSMILVQTYPTIDDTPDY